MQPREPAAGTGALSRLERITKKEGGATAMNLDTVIPCRLCPFGGLSKVFDNPEYFRLCQRFRDFLVETARYRGRSDDGLTCDPGPCLPSAVGYLEHYFAADSMDLLNHFLALNPS